MSTQPAHKRGMDIASAQALIRFGLGPRPGEALPTDPHRWLAAQLAGPDPVQFPDSLPTTADGLIMLREQRRLKPPPGGSLVEPLYRADAAAQLAVLLNAQAPFRERLVWFWANHFTVSIRQGGVRPIAGAFVREAIRPHVTGHFGDMLLAVMRHPAMLLYLDNAGSVGPDSPAGQPNDKHARRGLNENLARECLELHTISPAAGYSQADVTAFAAILTGWSIDQDAAQPGFVFRQRAHQPGDKLLMGRSFPEGEAGGVLALDMLASHPATYRHLAQKLAVHFIADQPTPSDVGALTAVLQDTRGDLAATSLALTRLPAAWDPATKFRTPLDYVVAGLRALDLPPAAEPEVPGEKIAGMLRALGQPVWEAPLPNGWPDRAADWAAPEAMLARIDWSYRISGRANGVEPMQIAHASLGPMLRPQTVAQIGGAGDRRDALTLLLSSPEFQRR
ncbi:DUF1800 domain-containing protein [Lichenicola sp.]|uniref:DUF1800 domain-containing protein n=1 Tax=Lichenicola sp. TaxID=2804529 RepID=UPI003B0056BF